MFAGYVDSIPVVNSAGFAPFGDNFEVLAWAYETTPDGNLTVDTQDFLALLALWGTDPNGPTDFDDNGTVDTTDFLALLANWGSCLD